MNPKIKSYLLHGSLFIVTFITTTLAGAEWTYGKSILFSENYSWADFASGLPYSICFLMILTCHEFGHYFTAVYYRVKTTLPFYIPIPPILGLMLGTLGALIRIKQPIQTNKQQFDIGIAGPLAGLVVALGFLIYGFMTLPPPEYVFQFHPEYQQYGLDYAKHVYDHAAMPPNTIDVIIGKNMLFVLLEKIFADPTRMPNAHEIMHYPFLFAGFLSLVFTGLNLLPIGQLDGGHVLYGLVGYRWHKIIAITIYVPLLLYCGVGFVGYPWPSESILLMLAVYLFGLYRVMKNFFSTRKDQLMFALLIFTVQYIVSWQFPSLQGYAGWTVFLLIIGGLSGVLHPPSQIEQPLNSTRKILGWFALIIFILCLTPDPITLIPSVTAAP